MYERYWGLNESPFQNQIDGRWFFDSPVHEEALARLLFLIEQRRRFGLLLGTAGTGKSLLLDVLTSQVQRTQRQIAVVDLLGLGDHEMLWQLAVALNLAPDETDSMLRLWRSVYDHLRSLQLSRLQTVLVFDHLERADNTCIPMLERLLHLDGGKSCWTTFVVASRTADVSRFANLVANLSDLRVELSPLDRQETEWHLTELLKRGGANQSIFDQSAIDCVFEQTRGLPRDINRLCDLALIAAMAEGRDMVDADVVNSAVAEMSNRIRPSDRQSILQGFG